MLTKRIIVDQILQNRWHKTQNSASTFAPSNIALAKYWGKRDNELNLPMNSSLSVSLGKKGTYAKITSAELQHQLTINQKTVDSNSKHGQRLIQYLNLFRSPKQIYYHLSLEVNIPFAAGLASSACVFAAIIQTLNIFHQWQLTKKELSILARLGSGSAARSIEKGFVEWQMGTEADGMDSYATALPQKWPDLCIGLCILNDTEKKVSSREGMRQTLQTSPLYSAWPNAANHTVTILKKAIQQQDFELLARTAENNALTMHATMMSAWPPLIYSTPETFTYMKQIWQLRQQGLAVYFTQDAGPNLKLLCLKQDIKNIQNYFEKIEWVHPFEENNDA